MLISTGERLLALTCMAYAVIVVNVILKFPRVSYTMRRDYEPALSHISLRAVYELFRMLYSCFTDSENCS